MPTIDQGGGGMLTGFLSPQGRILADAFVYPKNTGVNFPHPVFLVELEEQAKDRMLKTLTFYKLRAKVRLRDVADKYSVWSVWGPGSAALVGSGGQPLGHVPRGGLVFKGETTAAADVWLLDGRAPGMGLRLLLETDKAEPSLPAGFERVAAERYTLRRVLKGVPEGGSDYVKSQSVPLESNLDYMHGVNFSKGCYVGQELTIRTHHRGVVRKRIVPVLFSHASDDASLLAVDPGFAQSQAPAPQADIIRVAELDKALSKSEAKAVVRRERKTPPGKMGSTVFNAGLALMRLEVVEQFLSQPADRRTLRLETVGADGQRLTVSPWTPSWWPGNPEA
ncbi:ccr4 associated factor [Coemansia sp. IMI 209127]|nr:ccr4 associated factor [Coemansia sp. IMI 209127]